MATHPPMVPGGTAVMGAAAPSYRRNHRSEFAIWWREIDRLLLAMILALMAIGSLAVAAASPASAHRLSTDSIKLNDLHFFLIHLRWQAVGLVALFVASALPKDIARRSAIVLGFAMLLALMLVPVVGSEVNGARRWLNLGISLQPSEFLKPAFAICLAWILAWRARDPDLPVQQISLGLMLLVGALLMIQPDFGSTILFVAVWFAMMLLSGLEMRRILLAVAGGIGALVLTYLFYENARYRIDSFIGGGSAYDQVGLAQRTLLSGGWTGDGFWLGMRKFSLPEAHTDYIFSVIGEEFGLLACAVIVFLYLAITVRVLLRLIDEEDLFTVLAATGLAAQLGGQAFINILVNLQLFPSKGMTLPLISYGGSSTVALCLGVGFLLSITRRNPFLKREQFSFSKLVGRK
jgi:cell division protein FtsW